MASYISIIMTIEHEKREIIAGELEKFFTSLVIAGKGDDLWVEEGFLALPPTPVGQERKARMKTAHAESAMRLGERNRGKDQFLALCNQAVAEFRNGSTEKLIGMLNFAKKVADLTKQIDERFKKEEVADDLVEQLEGIDYIYSWLDPAQIQAWQKKLEELGIIQK